MFLLIDCNNFYASCEVVFNPKLKNKPLVILSNNDGCVIARSKLAKKMNIPMGSPIFQCKDLIDCKKLAVLSSNFTLYGDMSSRVMDIIESFSYPMEVYSIDEAFIEIDDNDHNNLEKIANSIYKKIYKWTGLDVTIGISKTKTLAKLATTIAKNSDKNVCILNDAQEINKILENIETKEIWGIGRNLYKKLKRINIFSAKELIEKDELFIKKHLNSLGMKTVLELKGISCLPIEDIHEAQQSILCSRSFHMPITQYEDLLEAVSSFVSTAAKKLRENRLKTSFISVFIRTSYFKNEYYSNSSNINMPSSTSYTPKLLSIAKDLLTKIYKKDVNYKKAGVLLGDFHNYNNIQNDFFEDTKNEHTKDKAMEVVDKINKKYRKNKIYFASESINNNWKKISSNKSKKYTTSWDELLLVKSYLQEK